MPFFLMLISCWMSVWLTLLLLLVLISLLALRGKISAYGPLGKESGSRFVAFAFESFGFLGVTAISFLRDLASYAKESFVSCEYISSLSSLAVLLQKGNAEMLAQGIIMSNRHAIQ